MSAIVPVTLEGQFVRLEPLAIGHAAALAAASSSSRETYGFTWVPDGELATRKYIQDALAMQVAGSALPFATVHLQSGQVVGTTRFGNIAFWDWPEGNPNQRGKDYPDVVEIGWTWLAPAAQRTPINSEAKLLMLTHAFETWHVHRVVLNTDSRNARSRAAIERIGGKLDGVLRVERPAADGTIRDTAVFSIIASEWPQAKAALEARLAR